MTLLPTRVFLPAVDLLSRLIRSPGARVRRVGVIGAGPGGLAAAALAARGGFEVDVFEAQGRVGGRNGGLVLGNRRSSFRFDIGPTFFLMPHILREIFESCGRDISAYLDLRRIDPLYELNFADGSRLAPTADLRGFQEQIAAYSPRDAARLPVYRERQRRKFAAMVPVLQRPYLGWPELVSSNNFPIVPFLGTDSVYDELASYFEDERTRLAFTFQAKYLGMSPFECPSLFTILPHIEHEFGVWHPMGGCQQISLGLARLCLDLGVRIHLSKPVRKAVVEKGVIKGLEFAAPDGGIETRYFDFVVMNADFAHGMKELFPPEARRKYRDEKLAALKYSCSTYMLYLGLKKQLPWPHHAIYFAQNYRKNIRELCESLVVSDDPSFYVHNPSALDPTLAPKGKSALYVLVPVPNLDSGTDWAAESPAFRERVLDRIAARTGIDLRPLIEVERVVTPQDWKDEFRVFKGATFSLSHTFDQLLHFRPNNEFEEIRNLYLVGGGTHPGSGIPTILESARISVRLMERRVLLPTAVPQMLSRRIQSLPEGFLR